MMKRALAMIAVLAMAAGAVQAASVSLAWDAPIPSDTVEGYMVYYGHGSRDYLTPIDVGEALVATVSNLNAEETYFFAVTAYNAEGEESEFSAELVWDNVFPVIMLTQTNFYQDSKTGQWRLIDLRDSIEVSDDVNSSNQLVYVQAPPAGTLVQTGTTTVQLAVSDTATNTTIVTAFYVLTKNAIKIPPAGISGEGSNGKMLQRFPIVVEED